MNLLIFYPIIVVIERLNVFFCYTGKFIRKNHLKILVLTLFFNSYYNPFYTDNLSVWIFSLGVFSLSLTIYLLCYTFLHNHKSNKT